MLVFLDESIRQHVRTNAPIGVLAGVAIPEDAFAAIQTDLWQVRLPYHGRVLQPQDEMKGNELLRRKTFEVRQQHGYSYHWNLAEETLGLARARRLRIFGVVCFRPGLHSFICDDEHAMDLTFRYLFERIDLFVKREFPGRSAKLVFDDRGHQANEKNARAITNFFVRSTLGLSYDAIVRVPFFGVSQAHNAGLQLADLVTTVIALRFQGEKRALPMWKMLTDMFYVHTIGGLKQTSLKVIRNQPPEWRMKKGPAAEGL